MKLKRFFHFASPPISLFVSCCITGLFVKLVKAMREEKGVASKKKKKVPESAVGAGE